LTSRGAEFAVQIKILPEWKKFYPLLISETLSPNGEKFSHLLMSETLSLNGEKFSLIDYSRMQVDSAPLLSSLTIYHLKRQHIMCEFVF
jgi:hypothetical protein